MVFPSVSRILDSESIPDLGEELKAGPHTDALPSCLSTPCDFQVLVGGVLSPLLAQNVSH